MIENFKKQLTYGKIKTETSRGVMIWLEVVVVAVAASEAVALEAVVAVDVHSVVVVAAADV
jgi:hypothetical protein